MAKTKKTRNPLVCEITEEEKADYGRMLADTVKKLETQEADKKTIMKTLGAEVDETKKIIRKLTDTITTGKEVRMVECEIVYNSKDGTVIASRLDTGEVYSRREMTEDERQGNFLEE